MPLSGTQTAERGLPFRDRFFHLSPSNERSTSWWIHKSCRVNTVSESLGQVRGMRDRLDRYVSLCCIMISLISPPKLSTKELMLLNCGVGEDSWEFLGLQGDPTVHSKGDQPWVFFGRTEAKAEIPILWPPHAKSWLIGKDFDAGRDRGQEEKGTTEDEMAGWFSLTRQVYPRRPAIPFRLTFTTDLSF